MRLSIRIFSHILFEGFHETADSSWRRCHWRNRVPQAFLRRCLLLLALHLHSLLKRLLVCVEPVLGLLLRPLQLHSFACPFMEARLDIVRSQDNALCEKRHRYKRFRNSRASLNNLILPPPYPCKSWLTRLLLYPAAFSCARASSKDAPSRSSTATRF